MSVYQATETELVETRRILSLLKDLYRKRAGRLEIVDAGDRGNGSKVWVYVRDNRTRQTVHLGEGSTRFCALQDLRVSLEVLKER